MFVYQTMSNRSTCWVVHSGKHFEKDELDICSSSSTFADAELDTQDWPDSQERQPLICKNMKRDVRTYGSRRWDDEYAPSLPCTAAHFPACPFVTASRIYACDFGCAADGTPASKDPLLRGLSGGGAWCSPWPSRGNRWTDMRAVNVRNCV